VRLRRGLAINGRRALDVLQERRVDLVITDLMMPVMDGAELATAIRGSAAHRILPIVLMTSLPSAVPPPRAPRALYDAILTKPFTPAVLLTTVDAIWSKNANRSRMSLGGHPNPATDRHLKTGHHR
jgi:CheY-like chemotaxis protein